MAGREIPPAKRYDGYLQLENGVGMLRLLMDEVEEELAGRKGDPAACHEVSIATGLLAYPTILALSRKVQEKYPNVVIHVYPIRNDFFGELITVSGLLTGQDLKRQLKGQKLGEQLLLPCNLLKSGEEVFLDDYTVSELETALQIPVNIVKSSGRAFVEAVLMENNEICHSYTDEVNKYE